MVRTGAYGPSAGLLVFRLESEIQNDPTYSSTQPSDPPSPTVHEKSACGKRDPRRRKLIGGWQQTKRGMILTLTNLRPSFTFSSCGLALASTDWLCSLKCPKDSCSSALLAIVLLPLVTWSSGHCAVLCAVPGTSENKVRQ
jgi:hypothetical protein